MAPVTRAEAAEGWDQGLLLVTGALVLCGVVMVYSSSDLLAAQRFGDRFFFLKRELLWVVVGGIVLWASARTPYQWWQRMTAPLVFLVLVLLVLVLIPGIGVEVNGARRWLRVGAFSFQPSELAKIAVVVYLASYITRRADRIADWLRGLLPSLVPTCLIVGLIALEPDFGTAVQVALLAIILLFLGGARWVHLGGLVAAGAAAAYTIVITLGYQKARVLAFLDPWQDPADTGFQIVQSLLAFGQGGGLGVGPGEGRQKLFYLPEPHTDYIYAVVGEEWGLVGTSFILLCFLGLVWRGVQIAWRSPDPFGCHLALGLTFCIGFQALFNMAVVTSLLPPKGLPLPFVSYGGSALVMSLLAIGILQNIARRPQGVRPMTRGWG